LQVRAKQRDNARLEASSGADESDEDIFLRQRAHQFFRMKPAARTAPRDGSLTAAV